MYTRVESLQSYPTLCNPMDCSPPGSSVHGILQARILEWVAMPSSRGSSQSREGKERNYWRIVDFQCCVNFCYTAKWFSYTYIYLDTFFFIFFNQSLNDGCPCLDFPKVDPEMWGWAQMVHLAEVAEETQMIQWKNRTRKFACLTQIQIRSSCLIGLRVS